MANLGRVAFGVIDVIAQMPRCCDCRWWDPCLGLNQTPDDADQGVCGRIPRRARGRFPSELKIAAHLGPVWTAPDFGCIQFEPREP